MNSPHQNKTFDVLQAILGPLYAFFNIFDDHAGAETSAAILTILAINVKIPPSELFIPKVSKSQNKCQKPLPHENVRDYKSDTGLERTTLCFLCSLVLYVNFWQ